MCRLFRLKAEIDLDFRSAAKAEDCSPVKSAQESVLSCWSFSSPRPILTKFYSYSVYKGYLLEFCLLDSALVRVGCGAGPVQTRSELCSRYRSAQHRRGARSSGENLNDRKVLVMVVVAADRRLIILMPLSRAIGYGDFVQSA
jgi:hypothetical protein